MSTRVFSARLTAGQETTFFGYPRGSNGKCAADVSDTREMIKKATSVSMCTIIMTLKAKWRCRSGGSLTGGRFFATMLNSVMKDAGLDLNVCKSRHIDIQLSPTHDDEHALISNVGSS